jgi:hypothetical protein
MIPGKDRLRMRTRTTPSEILTVLDCFLIDCTHVWSMGRYDVLEQLEKTAQRERRGLWAQGVDAADTPAKFKARQRMKQ